MPTRNQASYKLKEAFRRFAYASPVHNWLGLGRNKYDQAFWDEKLAGDWEFQIGSTPSGEARDGITLALIRTLAPNAKSILDVACASGSLFRASGGRYSYTGIDLSTVAIARGKELSPEAVFQVSAMEIFAPEDKYDVIVISEVLYFQTLDEAVGLAQRYSSYLAPSGILIITMAKDAKAEAIFRRLAGKMRWVNGFVYQEKNEGPEFAVRSEKTRVYLSGAYAPRS